MQLRQDADYIIKQAIEAVLPGTAVERALEKAVFPGRVYLVSVGKAAWQMADAAIRTLGARIEAGIIVTKYGHARGPLFRTEIFEAGHPVPDDNAFKATEAVLRLVDDLKEQDTVLFLLSGGGSALFELPLIPKAELQDLTAQMLACGADIVEMNIVRKRLSAVKGGRFALRCAPARVFSIVLSDILGDPLDMIASGPAVPDASTCAQAHAIMEKYGLRLSPSGMALLWEETPKALSNVETQVTGSVRALCQAAAQAASQLGYAPQVLTAELCCTARDAGSFLASIARYYQDTTRSLAFIAGGETLVKLTGKGLGGRNQELALAGAAGLAGLKGTALFSFGSDGTDGPTDAAGGFVDGSTQARLAGKNKEIFTVLQENDSYPALAAVDGLIKTGPTGTNVNDVAVLLIKR